MEIKRGLKMELKQVLKTIKEIEIKLKNQGMIKDERLLNHLENLNQIALELNNNDENFVINDDGQMYDPTNIKREL